VKDARESNHIHPNAPNQFYDSLIETTCEVYRGVSFVCPCYFCLKKC
jgi:hypothetical protein